VRDGRWRSLFIASPRSFIVLLYRRLYGLRAEGVAGVRGRGGAARRWGATFVKQLLVPRAWRCAGYAEGGGCDPLRQVWEGGVSAGRHICVEVKSDRRTAPVMTFSSRELKRGRGPRRGYAWGRGDGGRGCAVGATAGWRSHAAENGWRLRCIELAGAVRGGSGRRVGESAALCGLLFRRLVVFLFLFGRLLRRVV